MLTERRTSLFVGPPAGWFCWADAVRKVGTLGLEIAWLADSEVGGLRTFEGVLRASFDEVGAVDARRDVSGVVEGLRSLEMGN